MLRRWQGFALRMRVAYFKCSLADLPTIIVRRLQDDEYLVLGECDDTGLCACPIMQVRTKPYDSSIMLITACGQVVAEHTCTLSIQV